MPPVSLPLQPSIPHYRVGTTLDGEPFLLDLRWNTRAGVWYMDIYADDADETPLIRGVAVVLGSLLGNRCTSPLFPKGALIAVDTGGGQQDAGLDDLGTRVKVYFYPASEFH